MLDCIIFDMDDTLYDEADYCKSGFVAVAGFLRTKMNLNQKLLADEMIKLLETGQTKNIFNTVFDNLSINYDQNLIKKMVEVYRNHTPDILLAPNEKQALQNLHQKYDLAMLTDGFLPAQQLKVKALDIEKYFKIIIYTEQLGREHWKPSPLGFEKIMQTLNKKPSQCAYVADNLTKDFIAPNSLGFTTIQIKRKNRIHNSCAPSARAKPCHQADSIEQVVQIIEKLNNNRN